MPAPRRSFTASDILAVIDGATHLPGFTWRAVQELRSRLGIGAKDAAPTEDALTLLRQIAAFDWCRHAFKIQPSMALPVTDTVGAAVFVSVQSRLCPKCGCSETRMWTVNGYATKWTRPELPIKRGSTT